jgi:hypothetical protein
MKNLSIITKKDGHMTVKHTEALKTLINDTENAQKRGQKSFRLHLCRYTGYGRFITFNDTQERAMFDLFRAFDFTNYRTGNDAPRGGKNGYYIELDTDTAVNFLGLDVFTAFEPVSVIRKGHRGTSFRMFD